MPKNKKKKIFDEEIIENEISNEDLSESQNGTELPEDEDNALYEGEAGVPVGEALEDDSIPLDEKLELVKAAWEASEAKATEYLDGWQRANAEFANYKKRVNRDREQYNKDAVGRVVRNYLSVVDDLERALKERPSDNSHATWANGIELIYRKLVTTLENDGVTPMIVEGEMFDPNLHEAIVEVVSKDHKSGQIVDVIQTGYFIGERVLRPARVCIAA